MVVPDLHLHLVNHPTERLVGRAPALVALRAQIRHLAGFDTVGSPHVPTLLLQGETGTGKGLVARVIHDSGPRASGPFVEVNCAAIPDTMLEAELFGFEPGAFTDAKRAKPGLFEAASAGTLLLDEIDALPLALQGKLLTAIESKQVRRLGAVAAQGVDVKLIAASNTVLAESVAWGRFRADLYHRLAVVVLALPPLRARGEDIVLLAEALLRHYTMAHRVPAKRLSAMAQTWLREYLWPGNVRELSHVMERVTLLHVGAEVDAETLTSLCQPLEAPEPPMGILRQPWEPVPEATLPAQAAQIRRALVQSGGNVSGAARLLGVSRDTIRYRMQRYGIARPRLGVPAPAASPGAPGMGAGKPNSQRDAPLPEAQLPLTAPLAQKEATLPQGSLQHGAAIESHVHTPAPSWEQKPVAVLALELTWPDDSGVELPRYDLWTERARWEDVIRAKVRAFGGVLVEHTAARLVWVFGIPQGLEQLPQRAVHSALAIRQIVVDASAHDMLPCPVLRLAVHLGAVRVDRQVTDPTQHVQAVGETLTLPVRLLGQAEPGAIVISPQGGRLVASSVALEERPLQLRAGDPARVGGYVVVGVSPRREAWAGRRHPTRNPLVGRERELLLLDVIIEQVKAGRGQVVSLVGAPGMGKSRLLNEFRQRVSEQGLRYVEGQCLAYGSGTPYLPVVDLLRAHCEIAADDSPETRLTKVCTSLQRASLDPDFRLPFLLPLLGLPVEADQLASLSAEARKARTFEAMRQLFLTSSQHHPLVLAVEDLHWIDPTSEDLLASLVDGLAGASIVILATFRPGYRPRWLDKSYATQIALQPLSPDDSRELVRDVLRDTALPPRLEQRLLVRAEGNPFFLEELAYTVQDHGVGDSSLSLPGTIQAVLAARVDRLPTSARQLLQAAAVLGKDIAVSLLQAIAGLPEAALQQDLSHLQVAEFLYETGFFPDRTYTFKHALTQEVAYDSLPHERRRALHARIVEAIEARAGDQTAAPVERLAYHALQGEVWDKALTYCRQAGEKAIGRSAYREAEGFFEQALSAIPHLPEQQDTRAQAIDLRLAISTVLGASGDSRRILAALREAEPLAEALGDPNRLGQVSQLLSYQFYLMGAYDQAIATAQRALALATAGGDTVLQAIVNEYIGVTYLARGDYRRAIDYLEETVVSLDGARSRESFGRVFLPSVLSYAYLARSHAELGLFAEGRVLGEAGLRIAEAVGQLGSLMVASWGIGLLFLRQGDLPRALPMLERAMVLCQDTDIPLWLPRVTTALGAAYTLTGRAADAVPMLMQALERMTATETGSNQVHCCLSLGEAHLRAGHLEEAHAHAKRVLAFAEEHQERGHQAYALRLLGEITACGEPSESEQSAADYQQALAMADELGMRPLAAHCHLGLGMLYRQMGCGAEGRAALSTAIELYRSMDMTFWLSQAEAALAQAGTAPTPPTG